MKEDFANPKIEQTLASNPKKGLTIPEVLNTYAVSIRSFYRVLLGLGGFILFSVSAILAMLYSIFKICKDFISLISPNKGHITCFGAILHFGDGLLVSFSFAFLAYKVLSEILIDPDHPRSAKISFVDTTMICMIVLALSFTYLAVLIGYETSNHFPPEQFLALSAGLGIIFISLAYFISSSVKAHHIESCGNFAQEKTHNAKDSRR